MKPAGTCLAFAILIAGSPAAPAATPEESPAEAFTRIVEEYDAWRFHEYPELARDRGRPGDPGRITEKTIAAAGRRDAQLRLFLTDLRELEAAELPEADRLDHALLVRELDLATRGFDAGDWMEAIGPLHGPQQSVPQLADRSRFERTEDYEHYLSRLSWVPGNLLGTRDMLRRGIEEGRVPPRIVLAGVPAQFDAALAGGLERLRDPFLRFPPSVPEARRLELTLAFDTEVMPRIRAEFASLADWVRNAYLPRCRDSIAATDGPDGEAYYAYRLELQTTTRLSAREIHEIGLAEVRRIRGEMLAVIRRTDWYAADPERAKLADDGLFAAFIGFLRTDPRFYATSGEELVEGYRELCKRIDPWLPRLFSRLPQLPYGVREMPRFIAPTQTTAYYQPGSLPNGDPGWFAVNTYALDQRPTYEMVALALHEAVPGHHLQISLHQELDGVRDFRKDLASTAFVEGWALYAERLGIEMGLYADPYDDFGRLLYEMWRSCRLVVDPGMHALGWSRERAIDFMLANTALSELNIRNEIDRYIAWPGQACAYKLGELAIRRLRAEAEAALGERFSLRAFHDRLLSDGPLPLVTLEERMRAWIAAEAATPPTAAVTP
jgi:uncharacterized protein (DUF885 family)